MPFGKYKRVYFPENEIRLFAEKANETKSNISLCAVPAFPTGRHGWRCSRLLRFRLTCLRAKQPTSLSTTPEPFTEDNHRQLVQALLEVNRKHGVKVVISNSDTEVTRAIYQPFKMHEITCNVRQH